MEAMNERSPAYFKQFQKNFRFFVSEEKPSSMFARNYAVCMHFENGYCEVLPSNHNHVLFEVSDVSTEILKRNKLYAVLDNLTTETTGEILGKLKLAVEYNGSAPPTKGEATTLQKRLPNSSIALSKNNRQNGFVAYKSLDNADKTLNQQLQTDRLSTETLKRIENILYGPPAGAFCQIMDIFVSGYGKLDIDNDVLCVR